MSYCCSNIRDLTTAKPFCVLFPVNEWVVACLAESMHRNGFDEAHPIACATGPWTDGKRVVIDGHARLRAASRVRITRVPIVTKAFANVAMALEYAIWNRFHRHDKTDAEIHSAVSVLDAHALRKHVPLDVYRPYAGQKTVPKGSHPEYTGALVLGGVCRLGHRLTKDSVYFVGARISGCKACHATRPSRKKAS